MDDITVPLVEGSFSLIYDFYSISMKKAQNARFKYGQQASDFDEGVLFFMAPGQVFGLDIERMTHRPESWMILIHPDFYGLCHLRKLSGNMNFSTIRYMRRFTYRTRKKR